MENVVEFLILFDLSLFFTVFGFILKAVVWKLVFRILAMTNWFFLALFYSLTSPLVPMYGYVFIILAITFFLVLLYDIWMSWQTKKSGRFGEPIS